MGDIRFSSFAALFPELFLALAILLLLMFGAYRRKQSNGLFLTLGIAALAVTFYFAAARSTLLAVNMNGMFLNDRFTFFIKCLLLVSSALTLLLSCDWLKEENGRPFEFIILILLATLGMLLMVSANDLLMLYVAQEISSLAQYVLASFDRDNRKSTEAGLKYFTLGALASGMILFGMSLVYGFAGTISFHGLDVLFAASDSLSKGVVVGLILIIVGFCFKASAVPFHMWSPDVYEGAPTPVTAFFSVAPKTATLAIFTRLLMQPFGDALGEWQQVIAFISVASMLVGSLAAIMQTNIKRLLAYSSIGHVGYMLMGVAAGTQAGVQGMLIYLVLYVFMSIGMFGCILSMRRGGQYVENIKDLAGLSRTHPALAMAIALFMFSMAGIPPAAGFFAKFYVVWGAMSGGLLWLAVAGVLLSVVGCYYYIKIVKIMYFDEPGAPLDKDVSTPVRSCIWIGATANTLFFLLPSPLIEQATRAAEALLQ